MRVKIEIRCDNAAFNCGPDQNCTLRCASPEVGRILRRLAEETQDWIEMGCKVRDINGNMVGAVTVEA